MGAFISKISKSAARHVLQLTLYDMIRLSNNFEDVKEVLTNRTNWSIELFRNCFTIPLGSNGGYFFTLCTLSFLVVAENIHVYYGRLSPTVLKELAESIGYVAFSIILFAMVDISPIIVRIAGLVALSGSPSLATGLVLISVLPWIVLPILTYPARLLWKRKRMSGEESAMELGTELAGADGLEVGA